MKDRPRILRHIAMLMPALKQRYCESGKRAGYAIAFIAVVHLIIVTASGDMIIVEGREAPVYGRYAGTQIDEDGKEIVVFRPHRLDQSGASRIVFARELVRTLIINIEPERLERLDPVFPAAYRDYAEELAIQSADPEARELAIRLYLIVVVSGDEDLKNSALAGLVPLARNDEERRKFELLRFMAGGSVGGNTAAAFVARDDDPIGSLSDRSFNSILQLVRAVRRQDEVAAIDLLGIMQGSDEIEAALIELDCSVDELREQALSTEPLQPSLLLKLLQIEQQLVLIQSGQVTRITRNRDWAALAEEPGDYWVQLPTPENVTEFDPTRNRFRNGEWTGE
ncbi:MAG: hypothetical protein AAF456_09990 [Planctomycetota bacterium]